MLYVSFLCVDLSFMYFLQINRGQITLSCLKVNPKSIRETCKESLMRGFMKHVQRDWEHGFWKFLTSEGEPKWENSYLNVRFFSPTKWERPRCDYGTPCVF